jgi:iron-sulfur cluster assembly protein
VVSVTTRAQEKLKEVLQANGSAESLVRVAVIRGPHGCVHGWKLVIEGESTPGDTMVEAGDVRIVVEEELGSVLDGASIDYREDASGIGFIVHTPNAAEHGHGHGHGHGGGGCQH